MLIWRFSFFKHSAFLESTQNQRFFNVKFRRWFNVDKLTLFRRWKTSWRFDLFNVDISILIFQVWWHENKTVFRVNLKSTLFHVEFYRWINVDKSTLNQRGYHADRLRDVISTCINVESMLSESMLSDCWDFTNAFQVFCTSTRKSHSKAFIYLLWK